MIIAYWFKVFGASELLEFGVCSVVGFTASAIVGLVKAVGVGES